MADPRVSVVIPCYNGGADLPGALASLAGQTVDDFEVVVVDDGSTDPATLAVLSDLPAGTRLIRQANRGLSAARNAGMTEARAPILLPLDCDDRLAPEFLARTLAVLDGEPEVGFVHTWIGLAGDRRGILPQTFNPFTQLFLNKIPYCLMMRREAWEAAGGYDESMRQGYEDWEFNIRLAALDVGWRCIPEPLFIYTVRGDGMLQGISNRRRAQLWREIQDRYPCLYAPGRLYEMWRRWRRAPGAYPLLPLMALLIAHQVLSDDLFNRLFAALLARLSASARVKAA